MTTRKRNRQLRSLFGGLLCLAILSVGAFVQSGCSSSPEDQPTPPPTEDNNGTDDNGNTGGSGDDNNGGGTGGNDNPSDPTTYQGLTNVVTNPSLDENLLTHYLAMTISFNPTAHEPNWVAWELTSEKASGSVKRSDNFLNDPQVAGCPTTSDYTRSGYDRGHMCPAADNKWSEQAMKECFYMTNICPQIHEMNAGAWEDLETKCRQWAVADGTIYIVSGPILTDNLTETIGSIGVIVPERFFKVIIAPYSNPPRGIGFIMNNGEVTGGMQGSAMSIDDVEQITGHDFFSSLPDDIENDIESQNNFTQWSAIN